MNDRELEKFRLLLTRQRDALVAGVHRDVDIQLDRDDLSDEMDTASSEANASFTGRLREREGGLLNQIEDALAKIADGIYGECHDCGEEIAQKRLEARPMAELCIDCQSQQEHLESREG